MKKKIWAVVLAIALLLTSFPPLAAEAKEASASLPSDIKGHVHEPVLRDWMEHGLLAGYEDGNIKPNAKITRAEFIALVNRTFGYKKMADISRFKDVGRDAWYHDDIAKAVQAGYIAGTSATTMAPDDFITQEQVVVIAGRLGSHIKATDINKAILAEYTKGVSAWARADVERAILSGIFNPKIEGVSYHNPFSRANSVALLDRVLNKKRVLTVPAEYELDDVKQLIIDGKDITMRNGHVSEAFIATDDATNAALFDVEIEKDARKAIADRATVEIDGTPVTTVNTPKTLNGQPDVSKINNTILKGKVDKNDKRQNEKQTEKVSKKRGGHKSTAGTSSGSANKKEDKKPVDTTPDDDQSGDDKPGDESGNTGDKDKNDSDAQKALKARIAEAEKTLKDAPTILPVMDHLKQAIDRAAEVAKKDGQADDAYNNAKTALDHAIEAYTSRPENTLVYFPEKATFRDGDWVAAATGFRADSVQMVVSVKDNKITDMRMTDYSDDHFIGTHDYYHNATQFLIQLKKDIIDQHGGDIDRFLQHYRSMEAMRIRYYDRGTKPAGDNNDVPLEYRRENGRSDREKAKADQPPVFFDAYSGATCTCSGVSAALAKGLAKAYTAEHGDGNMITEIRFHDPTKVKDKKTQLIEGLYWLNYKEGETFDPNDVLIDIVHLNGNVETVGFNDLAKNGITLEMQTHLSQEDHDGNHTIVTPVTGPIKAEHDKKGNVFVWKHNASSTKLSMKFNVEYDIEHFDVLKVQYQIGKTMDPNGEWKDFEPYYEYQLLNPDGKGFRGIKTSVNHVGMKKPGANASEEEKNAYAEKERKLYASKKFIKVDRSHKGEKIFLRAFLDDGREVVFRAYKKFNYEPEVADNSKVIGEESYYKMMWEVPGEESDRFPAEISNKDYHERVAAESVNTEVQSLTFDVGKDLTNEKYNTENMGINQRAIQIDLIFTGNGGEEDYAKTPLGVKWHDTTMFNGEERNIREGHTAVSGTVVATLSGYDTYRFETRTIGSGSAADNGLFVIDGNQLKIGNLEELAKRSEFRGKINTDKTPYTLKGGDYAVNMVGVEAGGKTSKPVSSVHKLDEEDLESGAICDLHINSIQGETAELQALRYYIGDEKPASDADYTTIALPKGMSIEKYGNDAPRIKIRVPANQLGKKVFFKIVPIEEESKNAIDPELGYEYKPLTLDKTAGAGTPALIGFTRPGYGDSVLEEDEYRLSVSSGIDDFMGGEGSSATYCIQFFTGEGPEPVADPTSDYVAKDRGDFNTFYEEAFERIKEPKPDQLKALATDTPVGTAVVTLKGVLDPSLGDYKLKFVSPDSDAANEFALDGNTLKVAKPLTAGKKTIQIVGEHKTSGKYTNMLDLSELMAPVKENGSPQPPAEEPITLKTVQIIPFIKADADDPGAYNDGLYAAMTANAALKAFADKPFAYLLGQDPGDYVPKFKVKVVYHKGAAADVSETVVVNEKLRFGGNYTVTLDGGKSFKLSTDKLKPLVTSLSVAYVDDFDAEPAADAWIPVDLTATHESYNQTGSAEPIDIEFPEAAAGKFVKLKYDAPSGLSVEEMDNKAKYRKLEGAENNNVSLTVTDDSSYDSFTYRFVFKKAGSDDPASSDESITLKTVQIIPFIKADADDPGAYNDGLYAAMTANAALKAFADKPLVYLLGQDPGNYVPKFKVKVVYHKGAAADVSETVVVNEKLRFGGNYTVTLDGGKSFKLSTDKLKPLVTSLSVAYVDDFDAEPAADAWIPVDLTATHEFYNKTGSAEPIDIEFPEAAAGKFVKLKYDVPSGLSVEEMDNKAKYRKLEGAENNNVSLTVTDDSSYDSFTYRFAFKKAGGDDSSGNDEPGINPTTPAYTMEVIGTIPKQTMGKPFDGGDAVLVLKNTENKEIRRVSLTDAFADATNFVVEGWNGDRMIAYEGAVQDEVEYYYICDKKQYDAHPDDELYDVQSATAVTFEKAASSEDTSGDDGDILNGFDMSTVKSIELDGALPEQTEGDAFNAGDALLLLKDENGKALKRVPLAKAMADQDRFKVVYIADLGDYTYREDAYDGTYRTEGIYDFVILEKAEYERIKNDEHQELTDVIYANYPDAWPLAASIKEYLEKN